MAEHWCMMSQNRELGSKNGTLHGVAHAVRRRDTNTGTMKIQQGQY